MNLVHAAGLALVRSQFGSSGGGSGAILTQLAFFGAIFAIFYLLLIRPQQKQRREREQMLSAVKRGDRIVTTGGMHGTVTAFSERPGARGTRIPTVVLRASDGVKLEFDKTAIGDVISERTAGTDRDA